MLFCTTGNQGHFGPLVPVARAALARGHEVRVAAPASFRGSVVSAGLEPMPFADAPRELIGPVMATLPALPFEQADAVVIREVFGRIDAQAAYPGIRAAVEAWHPDVIVREPAELGSLAVAESAGLPHVQVAIGMEEMSRMFAAQLHEPLAELGGFAGLPDEALAASLAAEPMISSVPEVLDRAGDEDFDPSSVTFRYNGEPDSETSPKPLPAWGDPGVPLVYVTFGSVTGSLPPFSGVFREALDRLTVLPVRVLMTVGHRVDIAALGMLPPNIRVEAWRPQAEILPHAALVLHHGGFGTTMGAVAAGVPQLVAPIFTGDQVINARHVADAGAGRMADPGPEVVTRACALMIAVLAEPAHRDRARSMAEASAALPPPEEAVDVIATMVR